MERAAASTERGVAIDIRAEVNAVRDRLIAARRTVEFYQGSILPTRRNLTRLAQVQYDAMLLGVYQLLQIRQQEVGAMAEYLNALRDYWTARSDLEHAVGGRLPVAASTAVGNPASPTVDNATSAPMSAPPSNGNNAHQHHQP
jgi:cobalt-zinc-cadmium efflux system outer membrane protein